MNDSHILNYYWLLILLIIPLLLWIRYKISLGKSSQKALAQRVESLQTQTSSPLFVCIYSKEGHGVLVIENDMVRFLNSKTELLRIEKQEIINIEYSDLGFAHIVTATDRYKFAYIHHTKDAAGIFTMVFGPAWNDAGAVETFVDTLVQHGIPHTNVEHKKLIFLPQVKI